MPADAEKLNLGDAAPDFRRLGIDGKTDTLADFPAQPAPVLMGVFLSNDCPYSQAAETRLIPLVREFAGQGLAVVALNPNRPDGVRLDELGYSTYTDSSEEMRLDAQEAGFPFPDLYDGDTQVAALAKDASNRLRLVNVGAILYSGRKAVSEGRPRARSPRGRRGDGLPRNAGAGPASPRRRRAERRRGRGVVARCGRGVDRPPQEEPGQVSRAGVRGR